MTPDGLAVHHIVRFPRPSPSVFAYFKVKTINNWRYRTRLCALG